MNVANVASAMGAFIAKRRYLRGQGLTFVGIGVTLRRGYRRSHHHHRPVLRRVQRLG